MSKVGHNRIQLGDDSDPNKNFVIGTPSPNDGTLEVRKGTVEVPGDLVARFTGENLELGTTGQAIKSAAFLDVVGIVSQSGGVPTGAIIESGSNANGTYIRYADGTQICRRLSPDLPTITSAAGSVFVNGEAIGPYQWAAAFSSEPVEMLTSYKVSGSASHSWVASVSRPTTTQSSSFQLFRATSSGDAYYVAIVAIGRWF